MAKNIPSKHHFVPKLLVKQFANSVGQVFFCEKTTPSIKIRNYRTPFWNRHYYTVLNSENQKDLSAEYSFKEVEDKAALVVQSICYSCAQGKIPKLTTIEKCIWDYFFALQYQRTPDRINQIARLNNPHEYFETQFDRWEADEPERKEEISKFRSPENLQRLVDETRIAVQKTPSKNILSLLSKRKLSYWLLSDNNRAFVLGSNPVASISVDKNHEFGRSSTHLWLPVSAKVAVSHSSTGLVRLFQHNNAMDVRRLNKAIVAQSSSVVSSSKALLISLTKHW